MTPASQIVSRLGGFKAVGEMLGITRNAVQRWIYPTPQGLGDRVPMKHWPALVEKSKGQISLQELMDADMARVVNASPKRRKAA